MPSTDLYLIFAIEIALIAMTLIAVFKDRKIRTIEAAGGVSATVTRGDQSMKALYTGYAGALASFLVLVNCAEGISGQKVLAIVLAFACLSYLFYFSTWFRNVVFFPMRKKMGED